MLKKFERRRIFPFLCFLLVFASQRGAQQTLVGITGNVMDVSGAVVSLAGCGFSSTGLSLGGWLTASFFGKDNDQITTLTAIFRRFRWPSSLL